MTDAPTIAVFAGDGIGVEVTDAAMQAVSALERRFNFKIDATHYDGGAAYYAKTGKELADGAMDAAGAADAILLGAMGLPDIRLPDGTEVSPHLKMRDRFGLFAGVRPVKKYPNTPTPLGDPRADAIDLIILRESTEGLFASAGKGTVEGDAVARDTLVITRATSEKLFDVAFDLARKRRAAGKGHNRVTCVDKANVFVSMAFFRKIFDERAAQNTDVDVDYSYVDAAALNLVRRPWDFDVLVMENMFADILSDLGGGLVGGMGMAPCAEIGLEHALFQPAHGSAPDIAGQGKANPTAMLVSAAMMLEHIGMKRGDDAISAAGAALDAAVTQAYADKAVHPFEFGGETGTQAFTDAVLERIG